HRAVERDCPAPPAVLLLMSTAALKPTGFFHSITRLVPAVASTVAALATVMSFLFSSGFLGRHMSGGLRASWIALNPLVDTCYSLGDTIHLAATITDQNGAVILGARPTWTSENPSVVKVESDGTVIVKTPGTATIIAAVDSRTARAHIFVRQRVASVRSARDSTVLVPEGEQRAVSIFAFDARGHIVRGRPMVWTSDDTTIATVDSSGLVTGVTLGHTLVHATIDGFAAAQAITVFATPSAVEVIDGESQHANAGSPLTQPVVLRVLSKKGRPVPGATVRFRTADGMGSADPATATSDDEGRARTRWTLGDLAGSQHLLVTVDGADSSTTIAAEADPVASNTKVVAVQEHVGGGVGAEVGDPVAIRVTDAMGRLLSGVPVTWTALDGGNAEAVTARTDTIGEAHARWVLGRRAGTQRIRAQVGNGRSVPPITISASALPGPPHAVSAASGDHQEARVGTELPKSVVLRVVDSAGNVVADAPLTLEVSGGSVADSSVRTHSAGRATVRWRLGHAAGPYTLSARLSDGEAAPIVVTAKANAGAPEVLTVEETSPKTRAHSLARSVVATLKDAYGNPIVDEPLRFTTKTGSVSPASAMTDAQGRARVTWTLSSKAAENLIIASLRGTDLKQTLAIEGPKRKRK